jgi:hypothetical protein
MKFLILLTLLMGCAPTIKVPSECTVVSNASNGTIILCPPHAHVKKD